MIFFNIGYGIKSSDTAGMRKELFEFINLQQVDYTAGYSIVLDIDRMEEHDSIEGLHNVFWKNEPGEKTQWSEGYTIFYLDEEAFALFILAIGNKLVTMDSV